MFEPEHRTYEQNTRDDHRHVRDQAELHKLRKVFAVKSKSTAIQRSNTFTLSTHGTSKCKRSLRALSRILRERRHHDTSHTLRDLGLALTQVLRLLLAMRAHHRGSISGEWWLAREHLVCNDAEAVNI